MDGDLKRPFILNLRNFLNQRVRINVFVQYTVLTYTTKGWLKISIDVVICVNTFFFIFKLETWKRAIEKRAHS